MYWAWRPAEVANPLWKPPSKAAGPFASLFAYALYARILLVSPTDGGCDRRANVVVLLSQGRITLTGPGTIRPEPIASTTHTSKGRLGVGGTLPV